MAVKDFEGFAQLLTSENLQKNPELRDRLKEAVLKVDSDAVIQIGKEHGYDFTLEDIQAFHGQLSEGEELSDKDLENVAGGVEFPINLAGAQAVVVAVYGGPTITTIGTQPSPISAIGGGW